MLADEKDIEWQIYTGKPWVPFDEHITRLKQADVVLGIFGTTRKTMMVIPNKVYEGLAVGKVVITADTPAVRELLDEKSAYLVPVGNSKALADAILYLKNNKELREMLGVNGHAIFTKQTTPKVVVGQLLQENVLFS